MAVLVTFKATRDHGLNKTPTVNPYWQQRLRTHGTGGKQGRKWIELLRAQDKNQWGKLISPRETAASMIMHCTLCYISALPQLKGMTGVNKA